MCSGSVAPTTAPIPLSPPLPEQPPGEPVDQRGEALVQRPLGRRQVLDVGGAGIAGADQGEDPGPGRPRPPRPAAPARRRPSSGLAVKASAPSPATGPQGVGVSPTSAWA